MASWAVLRMLIFEWPLLATVSTTLQIKLSLRRLDELSEEIIESL